jgi:hypothetical protein
MELLPHLWSQTPNQNESERQSMSDKSKIEYVPKTVIENKLLAALASDEGQVAILATKSDLETFIAAIKLSMMDRMADGALRQKMKGLHDDLQQLLTKAFPD